MGINSAFKGLTDFDETEFHNLESVSVLQTALVSSYLFHC